MTNIGNVNVRNAAVKINIGNVMIDFGIAHVNIGSFIGLKSGFLK
jgi:hypothetical protein